MHTLAKIMAIDFWLEDYKGAMRESLTIVGSFAAQLCVVAFYLISFVSVSMLGINGIYNHHYGRENRKTSLLRPLQVALVQHSQ